MHVATTRRHYTTADGQTRIYEAHLLRRSFRDGGNIGDYDRQRLSHETAAQAGNVSSRSRNFGLNQQVPRLAATTPALSVS
jgi:hypothetical protein